MKVSEKEKGLQLKVFYNVTVDYEKKRISKLFSVIEIGKDVFCALLQTNGRHLFVHYRNVLKVIYHIAAWIRTLFMKCISTSSNFKYDRSGFRNKTIGLLDLSSLIPRHEEIRVVIDKKTIVSADEYSQYYGSATRQKIMQAPEANNLNEEECNDLLEEELGIEHWDSSTFCPKSGILMRISLEFLSKCAILNTVIANVLRVPSFTTGLPIAIATFAYFTLTGG